MNMFKKSFYIVGLFLYHDYQRQKTLDMYTNYSVEVLIKRVLELFKTHLYCAS